MHKNRKKKKAEARRNKKLLRRQAVEVCRKKLGTLETDYIEIARRICFDKGIEFKSKSYRTMDRLFSQYSGIQIIGCSPAGHKVKLSGKRKQSSKEFYKSDAWRDLRYRALKLHGRQCQCCGAKPPKVVLHVDHIKPRSRFPELELDINNLQVLCEDCNLGKSNKDCIDYRSH